MTGLDPRIRPATVADAEGITRIHVGGWQVHYRGLLPDAFLDALDYEERLVIRRRCLAEERTPATVNFVLEDEGAILGWASAGEVRDDDLDSDTRELYAIYLDPARVGEGLGRALMQQVLAWGRSCGAVSMVMWVLTTNERARRFYAAAGFAPDPRRPEEPFRDFGVNKLRMVRALGGDA